MRFLARRRQVHRPIDLNVIPLIDVVFFLLIFYVISTTFLQETAVPVQRPGSHQAAAVEHGFVPVAVAADGAIQVGPRTVSLAEAAAAVRAALAEGRTGRVVVIPDRATPTGLLLRVMDACSAGGANGVDVAALREDG